MIPSGEAKLIRTGLQIELPKGTEAQIRPRSGLALKHSVTVLNSPGTIDEGYRGEIGVIIINHGKETFIVEKSMRIAQMVIQTVPVVQLTEVNELSQSERGIIWIWLKWYKIKENSLVSSSEHRLRTQNKRC